MEIILNEITNSADETENIAFKFAKILKKGDIVAMYGDMGAGKTAFVRGAARGLNITDRVSSPTFSIVHEYDDLLYHFDMYRICGYDSLYSTGFFDYIDNGICFIEWAENIKEYLPRENLYKITIKKLPQDDALSYSFNSSENNNDDNENNITIDLSEQNDSKRQIIIEK